MLALISDDRKAVNKGIAGMPAPGSSRAPDFDPRYPEELKSFLEEFEEHAAACGLSEKEKTKVVVRYTDAKTRQFWKSLEGYGEDFEVLKGKILESYSKSQQGEKYTTNQLVKIISQHADGDIDDEDDLYAYYQEFWPVASYLVENKKINNEDRNRYFWKGLPTRARKAIRNRLEMKDSTFELSQVPTIQKAMEAGRFVFSKETEDEDEDDSFIEEAARKRRRKRKGKRYVSKDEEEESSAKDKVKELTTKLHSLDMGDAEYASTYARLFMVAPMLAEKIPPPTRWITGTVSTAAAEVATRQNVANNIPYRPAMRMDPSCHFCKQLHCRLRTCPVAEDYVRLKRVVRHPNGYLAHVDGTRIEWHPGGLRAAVDMRLGPLSQGKGCDGRGSSSGQKEMVVKATVTHQPAYRYESDIADP
ncbi:hypothetical protein AX17_004236 [Amanita inopinata Kibby_2008]|nr:hypothetical protein AX17_004236 [Amanita inopinata Kibby_2008]